MKVTVTKYLNVRVGKPSLNAPCYQYLAPGSEIEVEDQSYTGDSFDGINTWLKDGAGNYYWSGGLNYSPKEVEKNDYWFELLELHEVQKYELGDRSSILILDSGIRVHDKVFGKRILAQTNFVTASTTMLSIDADRHGTHCAGLICGSPLNQVSGVAPRSGLLVGKVTESGQLQGAETIKTALQEFLTEGYEFDVISISQTLAEDDPALEKLIQDHIDRGRIVVAAIGNDSRKLNLKKKRYPGFYNQVISVGSCEPDDSLSSYTCYPSHATVFCYGTNILSYKDSLVPAPLTGTSQATAIVAGVVALIVSCLKKKSILYNQQIIKDLILESSNGVKGYPSYKIIQPKKIFEKLI